MSAFLSAISDDSSYLEQFTATKYKEAFSEYTNHYYSSCVACIKNASDLHALCSSFFEELLSHRKKTFILKRSRSILDQKMMVATFFIPMLLSSSDDQVQEFAKLFQNEWKVRFPKDGFELCNYASIVDGFKKTLTGFEYRNLIRR